MTSFPKALAIACLCGGCAAAGAAWGADDARAPAKAPAGPPPAEAAGKQSNDESPGKMDPITLPIPVGHDAKGIKIPYFNADGVIKMEFFADQARRVDEREVRMQDVKITLYDQAGKADMHIALSVSVFDLETQQFTSDKPVTIQRKDFSIRGEAMVFDTRTGKGKLTGKVSMVIYDREAL